MMYRRWQSIAQTIPWSATLNVVANTASKAIDVTFAGNTTVNLANGTIDGQRATLRIRQDATGSRLVTWGTMFRASASIVTPVLSTAANALDRIGVEWVAGDSKWDFIAVSKGY